MYERLIRALTIFAAYQHAQDLTAEHDVIYAGPSPSAVTSEHQAELATLGWHPDNENDCWYHFT